MGSYVNAHLISGEQVVHETTLHRIIYWNPLNILSFWIRPYIRMATSEFAITNKRIIIKTGLISRRTLEMNLSKIESVNVNQGILGRILNFGTLTVIGTGGTMETFSTIADPLLFRRKFQELSSN